MTWHGRVRLWDMCGGGAATCPTLACAGEGANQELSQAAEQLRLAASLLVSGHVGRDVLASFPLCWSRRLLNAARLRMIGVCCVCSNGSVNEECVLATLLQVSLWAFRAS
jgi:hypothetical protein